MKKESPPIIRFDFFIQPVIVYNMQNKMGIYGKLCIFRYIINYVGLKTKKKAALIEI
jgi:hypothetical protein